MKWRYALLALSLLAFLASTVTVLAEHSYMGFFFLANQNTATKLMLLDLTIALTLVTIWMVRDARGNERSYVPHIALTLFFGVAGPLIYLVARPWPRRVQRAAAFAILGLLTVVALLTWNHGQEALAFSGRSMIHSVSPANL